MSRLRRVRVIADHRVILARSCRTSARRSTVVEHTMDVSGWLRKQLEEASPDLLRAMVKEFAEALMSADTDAVCGAGYGPQPPLKIDPQPSSVSSFRQNATATPFRARTYGDDRENSQAPTKS